MTKLFLIIASKYGLFMGVGFCIYTTFMWLTELDTKYLNIGQYLDVAIILLPLTIIFLAVRSATMVGKVSILQRVMVVVVVGLVSFLLYAPFLYAYHNYINPTWFDSVLILKESQLVAANINPILIAKQLTKMKEANDNHSGIFNGFLPSVIILPILIGLLTWAFTKNRKVSKVSTTIESAD